MNGDLFLNPDIIIFISVFLFNGGIIFGFNYSQFGSYIIYYFSKAWRLIRNELYQTIEMQYPSLSLGIE
jgi:hypothetical protein